MATLDTLRPTNDVAIGSWDTGTGGTTNIYQNVDDAIASPDGAYIRAPTDTDGAACDLGITNVNSDLISMATLSVQIRYALSGSTGNDTYGLTVGVRKADGTLLAGNSGGTGGLVINSNITHSTTWVNSSVMALTLTSAGQTATKAEWDAAFVRLTQTWSKSAGPDGLRVRVDAIQFTGTYTGITTSSTLRLGFSSITDPSDDTNHTLRVRAKKFAAGDTGNMTVALYDGATNITLGGTNPVALTDAWVTYEFPVTGAASMNYGSDVEVRVTMQYAASGTKPGVSWVQFELPEASSPDQNVNVTAINATTTVPSVTVAGDSNLTDTGQTATVTVPSVTVTGDSNLTDTGQTGTTSIPAVTVAGDANVTDTGQTGTATVPAVTVDIVTNVTDTGQTATSTVPAVTVAGDANIIDTGQTGVASVPSVTVTGDSNVTDTGQTGTATVPAVTVAAGADIVDSGQTGTVTVPAVTVTGDGSVADTGQTGTVTVPAVTVSGGATIVDTGQTGTGSVPAVTVTGGASIVDTGQTGTATVPAVTVDTGGAPVNVDVDPINVTGTVPAVTVAGDANVTDGGQTGTATVGTVDIQTQQDAQVSVNVVTGTTSVPAPTVTGDASVTDTGQTGSATVPSVTVAIEVTVIDTGQTGTATVPAVTVSGGADVTDAGQAATSTVPAVTVTGDASITDTGQTGTGSVPAVTVTGGASITDAGQVGTATVPSVTVNTTGDTNVTVDAINVSGTVNPVQITSAAYSRAFSSAFDAVPQAGESNVNVNVSTVQAGAVLPIVAVTFGDAAVTVSPISGTAQVRNVVVGVGSVNPVPDDFDDNTLAGFWTELDPDGILTVTETGQHLTLALTGSNGAAPFDHGIMQDCDDTDLDLSIQLLTLPSVDGQDMRLMVTSGSGYIESVNIAVRLFSDLTIQLVKDGTTQTYVAPDVTAPIWLRLTRVNDTWSAYYRTDPLIPWVLIGTIDYAITVADVRIINGSWAVYPATTAPAHTLIVDNFDNADWTAYRNVIANTVAASGTVNPVTVTTTSGAYLTVSPITATATVPAALVGTSEPVNVTVDTANVSGTVGTVTVAIAYPPRFKANRLYADLDGANNTRTVTVDDDGKRGTVNIRSRVLSGV